MLSEKLFFFLPIINRLCVHLCVIMIYVTVTFKNIGCYFVQKNFSFQMSRIQEILLIHSHPYLEA